MMNKWQVWYFIDRYGALQVGTSNTSGTSRTETILYGTARFLCTFSTGLSQSTSMALMTFRLCDNTSTNTRTNENALLAQFYGIVSLTFNILH